MKVVAMLTRSAGNAEVGSMWTDTKIFEPSDTIENVIDWARSKVLGNTLSERLTLQIAQEEELGA